ncbi:hypothetical protein R5W24_006095 [Gemmata sp. JC717]|uniref:MinD/ParA family ATP-binding protein n=1 Tax=Gemmata algarum TaxID=2975278 RepID=UPI0021BB15D0|nr:hypothetical protein [Gemmata algarum]MDY3556921.1 hypothetical protein [Gemmata algarum]
MHKIVSVHSPAGADTSNLTAHLAASIARRGKRLGVIETGATATRLRTLFDLNSDHITHTLSDHLIGRCTLRDAAYHVPLAEMPNTGSVHLIPAGPFTVEYDAESLGAVFGTIADALTLDVLFVDAPGGLGEDALLIAAAADRVVLVLRPNRQDYQTTAVAVEVVRRLGIPDTALVLSEVPGSLDRAALLRDLERAFGVARGAVLPIASEAPEPAAMHLPRHPLARAIAAVATQFGLA